MRRMGWQWATMAGLLGLAFAIGGCKQTASTSTTKAGKAGTAEAEANKPNEPNVTFPEMKGGSLPLASLKGKVVLVNFWATWCDPCRGEIPDLIAIQKQYADKGFTILGVAMDTEGKKVVEPFVQNTTFDVNGAQEKMSYPIMIGNPDIAEKFGGLLGYPTSVLISRSGKIVQRYIGAVSKGELQKQITALLQAPAQSQANARS